MCAAIHPSRRHNPTTVWNVSCCCQRLKPTLVEQLRYTVSGRVLSLPIRVKRGQAVTQVEGESEGEPNGAAVRETGSQCITFAWPSLTNCRKDFLLRDESRNLLFFWVINGTKYEEKVQEEEEAQDKEEEGALTLISNDLIILASVCF